MNAPAHTAQKELFPQAQPASQVNLTVVPIEELNRVEKRLIQLEAGQFSAGMKRQVSFRNKKGLLDSRTLGAFLQKGLPFKEKGLNSILKDQDHASRLARLQKLEAYYEIFRHTAKGYEEITPQDIEEKKAYIQKFRDTHSPNPYF